jgi:hypothetical protein
MLRLFDKPRIGRRREARVQRLRHIDDESLGRGTTSSTNDFHTGPPLDRRRPQTGFLGRHRGGGVARALRDTLRRVRVIGSPGRSFVRRRAERRNSVRGIMRRAWRPD